MQSLIVAWKVQLQHWDLGGRPWIARQTIALAATGTGG